MALSSDILRGYTDTILLNCLSGGDSYGYQMIKEISQLSNGALVLKSPHCIPLSGGSPRTG